MKQRIVLAMGGDELSQLPGLRHGRLHHFGILHAVAVVGEGDHIARHAREVGELLSLLVHRDGAVGEDFDHRVPEDDVQFLLQVFNAVRRGLQIRHGAHAGVAPAGRGLRAGFDGLLIGKARLSQMHMHICETGQTIQGIFGKGRFRRGDGNNFPALHDDVRRGETSVRVSHDAVDRSAQGDCLPSAAQGRG